MSPAYPRDFRGYGPVPPDPLWPGGARLALQFVINLEEGAERSVLNGDPTSEVLLVEMAGLPPRIGGRDEAVESMYEYGSRVGLWRLKRIFDERGLHVTIFTVGAAVHYQTQAVVELSKSGHEIACHHWRWIDYQSVPESEEREHLRLAIKAVEDACGHRPLGFFVGRPSPNTLKLVIEEGGFLYSSDAFNDELPYYLPIDGARGHLIIPYTFDCNDQKFFYSPSFVTGRDFFEYLRDSFDVLYAEGATHPKLMSVGLHGRMCGHPGRSAGLMRFLDHVQKHKDVWICRRIDVARHWLEHHPYLP
jgi:allantoinase